jgi:hypothetical protein
MTEKNNIRQDWLSIPRRREEERLDPHVYKRGINGLTVEEALRRAFPRVIDILGRSGEEYSEFEMQLVRQTLRACLISQVSRANLYRIAGILVAGYRRRSGSGRSATSPATGTTPPSCSTTTTRCGCRPRGWRVRARPSGEPPEEPVKGASLSGRLAGF